MVKVSVLLAVYNNKEDIFNAIKSVINQTFKDWELIIIDDCSTDGTIDVIEKFINDNTKYNIILIKNEKNMGVYSSLNNGLIKAQGTYISRIDSDDKYVNRMLEKSVKFLDENSKYIMVKSKYKRDNESAQFGEITSVYRKIIIDKIGYYDSVRFAGDTEFDYRITKEFNSDSIYQLNETLYYAKQRVNSLTTSKTTGITSAKHIRNNYIKNAVNWHNTTKKLYMDYPLTERPFPIDNIMSP